MSTIVQQFELSLALPFLGIGMKIDLFQSCGHCWVFQTCWHIECSTFTASYFRIWNSSTGILSPPLALFVVTLPKAHLTSYSRTSSSRFLITQSWLCGSLGSFLYSSVYSFPLFLIASASVQFSSVAQSCLTLCDPMNRGMPGLPVHHQLPEFPPTQVHRVSDAIQPFHLLLSPSPPAPNPSQHQSLFQWVNSSHEVAKVLEFQLRHHFFQKNARADLLQNGLVGSPCSPRDSQESSPTSQFKSINSSMLSLLHSPTLTSIHDYWKNHSLD